ncbi:MAG: radical SAM protein [Anaerotardibacter sp.]
MSQFEEYSQYASCSLCPHQCGVDRTSQKRGVCGAFDTLKLGRAALHMWEEPCLVGEQGSGAVFFSFCPLHCVYCQNKPLASGEGVEISLDQLEAIFLRLQNEEHAANINLVTPTHYLPHIIAVLKKIKGKELTIPVVYNTSGYESVEALAQLRGLVDIYLTDYKYARSELSKKLSHAPHYEQAALDALEEMLAQTKVDASSSSIELDPETGLMKRGVIVRHLVLPGNLENSFQVLNALYQRFGTKLTLSIMNQFTPLDCCGDLGAYGLSGSVSEEEYNQVLDYADYLGFEDYFWQDGPACEESFIPAFDGTGVY